MKFLHCFSRRDRFLSFLLVMTALLSPARMWGQETVTIGEGTTTNSTLPSQSYFNYALSQQLYTPAELTTEGTINSISFYNGGSTKTRNYTMYLVHTAKTAFSSTTDWITVTSADQVFSGDVSMTAGAWTTFTLPTPFYYDGVSNLALIMDDNSGYYSSGMSCRVFSSTSNCTLRIYADSPNYDPMAPTSYIGTLLGEKNQLQINITPTTTPKPQNLAYSDVTAHEATVSWTAPNEDVISYTYQYQPEEGEWITCENYASTSVNLSGLNSDTDYDFRVKAVYANGESVFASTSFHTLVSCPVPTNLQVTSLPLGATTATLSWTENGTASDWVLQYGPNSDFSNATLVNVSGTPTLELPGLTLETRYYARVKADCGGGDQSQWSNLITFKPTNCINVNIGTQSGTTYYYPLNTSCNYSLTQQIYTAAEIGTEGLIRSISFYYNYTEPLSLPGIKLYLKKVTRSSFTSNTDKESLTTTDLVWTGTLSAYGEGWVTIDLATPFEYDGLSNLLVCVLDETNGYPGSSYKFRYSSCSGYKCLYWYSDNYSPDPYSSSYSGSKGYNAYRNNILIGIQPATCPRPINLQATVTQSNATVATLNWTERGTATNWVLQYGTDSGFAAGTYTEKTTGFVANGSSITADLTGLTPETKYYARVKADCGGGDQSAWSNTVEFRPTNCVFVTIGQETNTTSAYPVYMNSSYSLSQQIYKPEEIGYEGLIQSISFYYNYTSPFSLADIKLYLKNVARNGFVQANYYDMEYVTTADLVWSGTLSATGAGWVTIDFDTPFAYDGVSNLLVTVCDQGSESYNSSYVFLCTNCDEYLCTYKYSSSLIDPYAGQYVSNLVKYRSNIQLGILPESYPRPYNLEATLSPSDATVASLSWTEKGTATSWVLQYGTDKGFAAGTYTQKTTGFVVNGTTITYDLTGLTPETRYYARVKANYGNGNEIAWSKTVDFKPTNCNYVTIGTDTYNSSNYIPVTTNYNYSLSQQIYRASEIGTEGLIRSISFYYYSFYELNMPNIKLYLKNVPRIAFASANTSEMEPLTEEDNLVWTGTLSATEKGWVTIDLDRPFAYDGVSNLLVAVWDGTNGHLDNSYVFLNSASGDKTTIYYYDASNIPNPSNPGSYSCSRSEYRNNIQIGIQPPDCPKPSNLQATLSPSNATVATLSWTELGDATNWVLQYGTDSEFAAGTFTEVSTGFVVDGTTVTANLTGLTAETRYYARVKANCGSSESLWSGTIMFRPTNCTLKDLTPTGSSYSNTSTYPVYMSYNYSLTQQIYTADQIGMEGLIYSISFYYNTSFSFSAPDVKLYMKNVTRNAFASSSDIEPLTEDDLVWTGTFTATEAGWITIYLDEPFDYDGQSNLLVSFWDNSTGGYYDSNYQFRQYYYSSAYRSICWYSSSYSSSYIPNPYNTNGYNGSKTYSYYQNNIQLNILPTTMPRPRQLTAGTVAARSATLSWTAPNAENLSGYQYQYKEGEGEWTTWSETITELSASLTGLTPETEYTFRVKAIYSNGESGFISTTFTTIPSCLPVNTPTYSDLTAHSVTISWTLQDENQDNWDLYYTHNSEDHPDNPTTYGYLIEGITTTPSYDLTLSPEAPYYIYVRANCGDYDGYSAWSTRINFAAPVACFVPSNLTVSNITNTSADFTWTPNSNGSETAWQVSYNTVNGDPLGGTLVDVEGTPSVTLQLNENTTYYVYVRANCGDYDGMSGWCSSVTFTTLQTPFIVDVPHPYSDGFENGNNWAFVNRSDSYYSIWINGNLTGNNSSRAMYIGYRNSNNQYYYSYNNNTSYAYATKRFHLAPGTYEVSYDWRCRGQENYDYCRVALVPDDATFSASTYASYNGTTFSYSSVPSEFIVLDNGSQLYSTDSDPSWQNQYHEITITEEANYKVLFYWRNNNSTYYRPPIAIDNFLINVKVGPAPSNLVVSNVETRSADLTWTENGNATAWQVKYIANGGDPYNDNGTVVEATTTSLTLTGLRPETYYNVYVRSCIEVDGEIQYTRWSESASFTTDISCYPVTDLEITSLGNTTATLAWNTNEIQPAVNAPNSWEVVYYKAPQITYDFETNTPDYDDDNWAVGEENGNHYLYNLASNVGIYFDIVGGGVVTFKAKKTGDNTGWIYVICNNYEMESFGVYSTSEYETYQIDLSNYPGNVELNLQIYSYVALDDITVNQYAPIVTHPTFDFNQGTIYDYADADGWSLDEDEGYIVSQANYTNSWGGAWVDFTIQLGDVVSFSAKALEVTEAETYKVYIYDTDWHVIDSTTITVTDEFDDYVWDLSDYSGYAYLEFMASNQPSLAIDDLTLDFVSYTTTQIVDYPTIDLTGLQQFAFYEVYVRALCGEDDMSQWESISFMPALCDLENQCAITYNLYSPYEGAWEAYEAYITVVHHESGLTVGTITNVQDEEGWTSGSLNLCDGEIYDLDLSYYIPKSANDMFDFAIYGPDGYLIADFEQFSNSSSVQFTMDCSACHLPDDLVVTNLMPESALVTWQQGDAEEAYNVRYRKTGAGTQLINEGFENLQEGLPTNWLSAISNYVNDQQVFEIEDEVWDLVSIQGGAISGNNMLQANDNGLLLIPVQNAGLVSLKVSAEGGEVPFEKNDIYSSLAIGVFNGDINNPFELTQQNIKLEVNPSGTQTCTVDLDGYTGYLVVYGMEGICIDDVMVYAPVPWTTLNNYQETSLSMSNLEVGATYQVQVQSICDADDLSRWGSLEFTTPLCDPEYQCNIKYVLWDNCNDGWEDAYLSVVHHTSNHEIARLTISSGGALEGTLAVCEGETYDVIYTPGYCCYGEHSFAIYNHLNEFLFGCETGDAPSTQTTMFTYEVICSNCFAPTNVDYDANVTSATIYWEPGEAMQTAWEIQYSTDQTNWTTIAVTSDEPVESMTYILDNLSASTLYYIRLRSNCGDDGYSAWTSVLDFRTDCAQYQAIPYYEDFESYDLSWPVEYRVPQCWMWINESNGSYTNNQSYPTMSNDAGGSATKYLYFLIYYYDYLNYHYGLDPQPQYAIMPEMESLSNVVLRFSGKGEKDDYWTDYYHTMVVGYVDESDVFHPVQSIELDENHFTEYTVNFNYPGSGSIYFMLDVPQTHGDRCYVSIASIDNISVELLGTELAAGWNWWAPTAETTVADLTTALGENLLHVKAETGELTSGNLVPGQMYRLQVAADCTLPAVSTPAASAQVSLAKGAHWFGFIGAESSVTAAFADFGPAEGDKVISQNGGFAIFNGTAWEGTLTTLVPGQGYVYVSTANEAKTLNLGQSGK